MVLAEYEKRNSQKAVSWDQIILLQGSLDTLSSNFLKFLSCFKDRKRMWPEVIHVCPLPYPRKKINGLSRFTKMGLSRSGGTSPPYSPFNAATAVCSRGRREGDIYLFYCCIIIRNVQKQNLRSKNHCIFALAFLMTFFRGRRGSPSAMAETFLKWGGGQKLWPDFLCYNAYLACPHVTCPIYIGFIPTVLASILWFLHHN